METRRPPNLVGRLPDCFSRFVDVSRLYVCTFSNEDFRIAVLEVEFIVVLWVDDKMTLVVNKPELSVITRTLLPNALTDADLRQALTKI